MAMHLLAWAMAAFDARYEIIPVPALMAAMDALLMIEPPPWSFMYARRTLGSDNHPEEVHVHDPGEVLKVVRQEPLQRASDARVVEHDVQTAEAIDREVDQRLHLVRIAHVGLLEGRRFADLVGQPLAALGIDIADHDLAPSATSSAAVARPIPPAPPVTIATFPCKLLPVHATTLRSRSKCRRADAA